MRYYYFLFVVTIPHERVNIQLIPNFPWMVIAGDLHQYLELYP